MSKSFEEFSKIILEKYSKTPDECDPYTNFCITYETNICKCYFRHS